MQFCSFNVKSTKVILHKKLQIIWHSDAMLPEDQMSDEKIIALACKKDDHNDAFQESNGGESAFHYLMWVYHKRWYKNTVLRIFGEYLG